MYLLEPLQTNIIQIPARKKHLSLFSSIVIDITDMILHVCFFGAGCDALETNPAPSDNCNFWASPHFHNMQYVWIFIVSFCISLYIYFYKWISTLVQDPLHHQQNGGTEYTFEYGICPGLMRGPSKS